MIYALCLVVGTSVAMSALLTWSVWRVWKATTGLFAVATQLAAQAQATTAHAALLSGVVDDIRRDLLFPDDLVHGLNYKFLEGDD